MTDDERAAFLDHLHAMAVYQREEDARNAERQAEANDAHAAEVAADTRPPVTVTVPRIFFEDHEARQLVMHSGDPADYTVKATKLRVTVRLHARDLDDLRSDAHHYAGFTGEDYGSNRSVCNSARSTVRALRKAGEV